MNIFLNFLQKVARYFFQNRSNVNLIELSKEVVNILESNSIPVDAKIESMSDKEKAEYFEKIGYDFDANDDGLVSEAELYDGLLDMVDSVKAELAVTNSNLQDLKIDLTYLNDSVKAKLSELEKIINNLTEIKDIQ